VTDLKLRYTSPSNPVVAPTDVLHVRAGQSDVMLECMNCGWRSQLFRFAARKVNLAARVHFLGFQQKGVIKSWRCKQRT
jgi:hypothetical protein